MRNYGHAIRLRFFLVALQEMIGSPARELTLPFEEFARFEKLNTRGPSRHFRRTKHFLSERKLSGQSRRSCSVPTTSGLYCKLKI